MTELKNLGQNIRLARKACGISQEGLAEASDLHRTYVCDVERGSRNVSVMSLVKIARGLGVSVSDLTRNIEGPDTRTPALSGLRTGSAGRVQFQV